MQSGGNVVVHIGADVAGLARGFSKAKGMTQKFGAVAQSTGRMMTRGLSLPLIAIGAASVKLAADFDQSMRNVNSIAKLPAKQFDAMRESVLKMSKDIGKAPKDLADGLYDIASSGFQGAAGLKVLEASAKAARAGMSSTAVASKAITGVLNAYGLSAEHAAEVGDILFKGVDRGVITFEELAQQLGDVISTSANVGISLEETVGAIAAFTKAGVNGAEAVTALNKLQLSFIRPSKEMAKFIKASGYESGQAMLKTRGLAGAMDLVQQSTKGESAALAALFPDVREIKGAMIAVAGGGKLFRQEMNAVKDHTNAMGKALDEQNKGSLARFEKAMARMKVAGIRLGDKLIPSIARVVESVAKLADGFASLPAPMQDTIIKMGALAIVAGPVVQMVGSLASLGPGAAGAMALLAGKLALVAAAAWAGATAGVQFYQALVSLGVAGQINTQLAEMYLNLGLISKEQYAAIKAHNAAKDGVTDLAEAYAELKGQLRTAHSAAAKHKDLTLELRTAQQQLKGAQLEYNAALEAQERARKVHGKGSVEEAKANDKVRDSLKELRAWQARVREIAVRRAAAAKIVAQRAEAEAKANDKVTKSIKDMKKADIPMGVSHKRTVAFTADTTGVKKGAKDAKTAVAGVKGKTIKLTAPPQSVVAGAKTAQRAVKSIKDRKVSVTAPTGPVESAVATINRALASIDTFIQITIQTVKNTVFGTKAGGGVVQPGEITLVGERGPEIVALPTGSRVYPSGTGPTVSGGGGPRVSLAGGGGGSMNFFGDIILPDVQEPQDFAPALMDYVSGASRAGNMSRRSRGFTNG